MYHLGSATVIDSARTARSGPVLEQQREQRPLGGPQVAGERRLWDRQRGGDLALVQLP